MNKLKSALKYILRTILGIILFIAVILFIAGLVFMIPSVQTKSAQKAADFFSKELQSEISIEKLRITWNLGLYIQNLNIKDRHRQSLLYIKKANLNFPTYSHKNRTIGFTCAEIDSAAIYMAKYKNEKGSNLSFIIDYFKSPQKGKPINLIFKNLKLKNSRYEFFNEPKCKEDIPNVWNYLDLRFNEIYIALNSLEIKDGITKLDVKDLKFLEENSKSLIYNYSGDILISKNKIYCTKTKFRCGNGSDIDLDFRFDFKSYSAFTKFSDSVFFNCILRPSTLNSEDLKYFVPAFKDLKSFDIKLEGNVQNSLSKLKVKNFRCELGDSLLLNADIYTQGLPEINNSFFDINLRSGSCILKYLDDFNLPEGKKIELPKQIKKLIVKNMSFDFHGSVKNFIANVDIRTNAGNISANGFYKENIDGNKFNANFETENLAIQDILSTKLFKNLNAKGNISSNTSGVDYEVNVLSFLYKDYKIKNINVSGDLENSRLTIQSNANDSALNAEIKGFIDFDKEKQYYITLNLKHLNLSSLQLFRKDSNASLAMRATLIMNQNEDGKTKADLNLQKLLYTENKIDYKLGESNVIFEKDENNNNTIQLFSDPLIVKANGNLKIDEIVPYLQQRLVKYIPDIADWENAEINSAKYLKIYASVAQENPLFEKILSGINIGKGSSVDIKFGNNEESKLNANIPNLNIKGKILQNAKLICETINDTITIITNCDNFTWKKNDSASNLQNIALNLKAYSDSLMFNINADKDNLKNDVNLEGKICFSKEKYDLFFDKLNITLGNEPFHIDKSNHIILTPHNVEFKNVGFFTEKQYLGVHGNYSKHQACNLSLNTVKLNLSVFDMFVNSDNFSLSGIATGNLVILRPEISANMQFMTDLKIDDFAFNGVKYGKLNGKAFWIEEIKAIKIMANLYSEISDTAVLKLYGIYNPLNKSLDLNANMQSFNIAAISSYLSSFSNKTEGLASGSFKIKGQLSNISITGDILLKEALMQITYINTNYHINEQKIQFIDTQFVFKNFVFTDDFGNSAVINGNVNHKKFKNWKIDLFAKTDNIMLMNMQNNDNDLFKGNAFGSGNIKFTQNPESKFTIKGDVVTNSPTYLSIILNKSTNVQKQNSYLIFEKPYSLDSYLDSNKNETINNNKQKSGINLSLNIGVTPETNVKVVLDPSIGGTIVGNGSGNLRMEMLDGEPFEIYGTYTLSEGNIDLAIGNIFTRNLKIESGSNISWDGNPENGQMDVNATYTTKTSITDLLNESSISSSYRSVPVTAHLRLNGNLLNPNFNFNIKLNDVDESIKSIVYNAIDTTNKEEMFRQAFSLMLIGRFEAEQSTNTTNYGIGYSLSELFSHYLQKMMSSITENVNLGVLYHPGDGYNNGDLYNVNLSTNLLENRLSIQGSLDIYGEDENLANDKQAVAGNVVGDIIIEYKITKDGSLRVKAFNMANYYDVLSAAYSDVPYYQGIGLTLSKDFNNLKDLFKIKNRKKRGQPN